MINLFSVLNRPYEMFIRPSMRSYILMILVNGDREDSISIIISSANPFPAFILTSVLYL